LLAELLRRVCASISFAAVSPLRAAVLCCCILFAGCAPGTVSQNDEQKDPYFLAGKNRLQERDYQGAIEMFEKALDVNPRSASSHFELGVLYEQQQVDYAAALYHYGRAVMLNSNAPFAELSRQRMLECKRELAKSVVQPLSMQRLEAELETLRAENLTLKQQLQWWQAYAANRTQAVSNTAPVSQSPAWTSAQVSSARQPVGTTAARTNTPPRAQAGAQRLHTIAAGDTPATIARRYNVRLSALEAANPTMDARRLRPGQTLVIPAP
jgi:tetratricopeptide (TPR) repeat protein